MILLCCVLSSSIYSQNSLNATQIDTIKISKSSQDFIFSTITDTVDSYTLVTRIEIYDQTKNVLVQTINDTCVCGLTGGNVSYIDINFDGYIDIEIFHGMNNLIPYLSFWLYDKYLERYFYSEEFSELNMYYVDYENKEITSVAQATGGRGGYSCNYGVKNGRLIKIVDNYIDWDDHVSNIYSNNEIAQTIRWKKDEFNYDGEVIVFEKYAINDKSEILIEKSWRIDKGKYLISDDGSGVIVKEIDGVYYQMLKKEVYSYEEIGVDTLLRKTRKYEAIGNKLKEVTEFK